MRIRRQMDSRALVPSLDTEPDGLYTCLREDNKQIRLIHLMPVLSSDKVLASLEVASLEESLSYETLSYVWGNAPKTHEVAMNDKVILVTKDMFDLLRDLRLESETRTLWIDAICINQDDLEERASQVQLMQDLYLGCTKCIIWLGEEAPSTYGAFVVLRHWGSSSMEPPLPQFHSAELELLQAVVAFMLKPWWTRTWTVQETILPSELEFAWGKYRLSWRTLVQAVSYLKVRDTSNCDNRQSHTIWRLRKMVVELENFRPYQPNPSLLFILSFFSQRNATDSRDKVFGLLALLSEEQRSLVKVDYTLTPEEIYMSTICNHICQTVTLKALSYDLCKISKLNLPSWVPDFDSVRQLRDTNFDCLRVGLYQYFNACNGFKAETTRKTSMGQNLLVNRGTQIDKVIHIGQNCSILGQIFTTLKSWQDLVKEQIIDGRESMYVYTDETFQQAFFRILFLDSLTNSEGRTERMPPDIFQLMREMWFPPDVEVGSTEGFMESLPGMSYEVEVMKLQLYYRTFFITEHGFFGIGSEKITLGDEVYVPVGGNIPYVLRPVEEALQGSEEAGKPGNKIYTLIGDCYAHGIMDGEAIKGLEDNLAYIAIR